MYLTKEDLGVVGVGTYGEKLKIVNLIRELKVQSMISDGTVGGSGGYGSGSGSGYGSGYGGVGNRGSLIVPMEDGKGAPLTDAPPSYN
jgi:hypothetical protein